MLGVCLGGNVELAGTRLEVSGLLQGSAGSMAMSDLGTGGERMKDPRPSALTHGGK